MAISRGKVSNLAGHQSGKTIEYPNGGHPPPTQPLKIKGGLTPQDCWQNPFAGRLTQR